MLNSLYGKFGAHNEITVIHNDKESTLVGDSKQANIIWAAYVTAYARLRLLEFLRSTTRNYYTDTDSLFTPDQLPVSTDLGTLKLEGTYKTAWFKGNKIYAIDAATKAKGVPRNMSGDFFNANSATYRRPTRFRESRRRHLQPNIWNEVTKVNRKEFTKRKIMPDGSTEPWDYLEYKRSLR